MSEFKNILRQIKDKHGIQVFTDGANCKVLLKDCAAGEYQEEQSLFTRMLDAGCVQAILDSREPDITKKQVVLQLGKDMLIAEKSELYLEIGEDEKADADSRQALEYKE